MISKGKQRTEARNDGSFLAVLSLETRRNPRAVRGCIGHTADSGEHITRGHDQGSENCDGRPGPAVTKNGG